MSKQLITDLRYVVGIIPTCYTVTQSKQKAGSINCKSTGTNKGMTDQQFDHFFELVKKKFGKRLQEIDHNVNAMHQNFTIFLRSKD